MGEESGLGLGFRVDGLGLRIREFDWEDQESLLWKGGTGWR